MVVTKSVEKSGIGTHGHKRGRPMVFKREVVRALLVEARKRDMSLRALCTEKGIVYISVCVARARYGLAKKREVKQVATA